MARKNLLEHLMGDAAGSPATGQPEEKRAETLASPIISLPPRRPGMRGVGVVGHMSESLGNLTADLKAAQEQAATVLKGETVIEIPTDLIDPSFVVDRLGEGDITQLTVSIRQFGQQAPILVRPHPDHKGRYQTAFGHRRVRVLKSLGLPARAVVKPLTDQDLVIAQGQENQRRDLSFIERALFASRLEGQSFTRDVICSALDVDKTELSRLLSIIAATPSELIEAIGPALKIGRRKWLELASLVESLDWSSQRERIIEIVGGGAGDSDARFEQSLQSLKTAQINSKSGGQQPQASLFTLEKKRGIIQIRFDENKLPKHVVDECVAKVRELCNSYGAKKVT